jgi:hypothetical protein
VDSRYELEQQIRSLAALPFGQAALTREDALKVLTELRNVQARLDRLRDGLRALVQES